MSRELIHVSSPSPVPLPRQELPVGVDASITMISCSSGPLSYKSYITEPVRLGRLWLYPVADHERTQGNNEGMLNDPVFDEHFGALGEKVRPFEKHNPGCRDIAPKTVCRSRYYCWA